MRDPSLRQLEALMAVIETGTVSRAAEALRISQPAASKLIQDLEADTELQLFERDSGRLVPTGRGMRLYEEVDRIFGGVNQLARAVEAIRREEMGNLVIGTMPAFSGAFISKVVRRFRMQYPNVFISIESRSSQFLAEAVLLRRLDLALVIGGLDHGSLIVDYLEKMPALAVLPIGHELCSKDVLVPEDFEGQPFIAFGSGGQTRRKIDAVFEEHEVRPRIIAEASTAPNVAELVSAGMGVTVADPASMTFVADRAVMRPFRPDIFIENCVLRPARARNSRLAEDFVREVLKAASELKMPSR